MARLLTQESDHPGFYNLILTYCELRRKLEHPELQSWYFKRGIDSNRKRLAKIEVEYESRRAWFNEGTIDDFIEQRDEASDWMERGLRSNSAAFIKGIIQGKGLSTISRLENFMLLKTKIKYIESLDYYYKNPDKLKILL